MNQTNVPVLTFLAVVLFISGIMLYSVGLLGLGLTITGMIFACTTLVINEIRDARRRILEKLEKRDGSPPGGEPHHSGFTL